MNKLKKILITGAAVIMMVASLSGCGTTTETTETVPVAEDRFTLVERDKNSFGVWTDIYVDKETGVMYLFVKDGYGGGLTVMVDEEGNPLIWDGKVN